jgi:glycosyltransferase involved in cell wall biosynthesis
MRLMRLTFFGTYNVKTTQRVQALIDGLRAHDIDIQECNVPLRIGTAGRVAVLQQPWRLPMFVLSILRCWIGLLFKARHTRECDAVIIGHLGQFDIHLAHWLFRGTPLILDYMISGSDTARDRQISSGPKDRLLRRIDNAALRRADIIVVDTEEHRRALPSKYRAKGVVVGVGAPQSWFEAAPGLPTRAEGPVRVVFFGVYTPLQGAPTIGQALSLLKVPAHITMIGHGQELAVTKQLCLDKNKDVAITWLDWVEATDLPKLVAGHDICLGIFGTGSKAQQVVPNKVYQGSAVGCAILTADTPPQRRILGDAAVFVPAGDSAALAHALEQLAHDPHQLDKLRKAAYQRAQSQFTPQKVVLPLLEKLRSPV